MTNPAEHKEICNKRITNHSVIFTQSQNKIFCTKQSSSKQLQNDKQILWNQSSRVPLMHGSNNQTILFHT